MAQTLSQIEAGERLEFSTELTLLNEEFTSIKEARRGRSNQNVATEGGDLQTYKIISHSELCGMVADLTEPNWL
jgi:hypothetical protein